ncbi:unnamed protein product [Rhizopus stolonifer]
MPKCKCKRFCKSTETLLISRVYNNHQEYKKRDEILNRINNAILPIHQSENHVSHEEYIIDYENSLSHLDRQSSPIDIDCKQPDETISTGTYKNNNKMKMKMKEVLRDFETVHSIWLYSSSAIASSSKVSI